MAFGNACWHGRKRAAFVEVKKVLQQHRHTAKQAGVKNFQDMPSQSCTHKYACGVRGARQDLADRLTALYNDRFEWPRFSRSFKRFRPNSLLRPIDPFKSWRSQDWD